MLEEVYGRLGQVRHGSDVVEYRVEQHFNRVDDAWIPKGCERGAPRLELDAGELAPLFGTIAGPQL
jgi:hypothetical protein